MNYSCQEELSDEYKQDRISGYGCGMRWRERIIPSQVIVADTREIALLKFVGVYDELGVLVSLIIG